MGLFKSREDKEAEKRNAVLIERLKTADLRLEENEDIIRKIRIIADSDIEKATLENYELLRSYLKNILGEDVAEIFMPLKNKGISAQLSACNLINCWKLEGTEIDDDGLLAALKNNSFQKRFLKSHHSFNYFGYIDTRSNPEFQNFFNGSALGIWGLEEADDENSIIYNFNLWENDDANLVSKYIQIDNALKADPEKRKRILYKEDGSLRSLSYIVKDLEK